MKQTYQKPEIETIEISIEEAILNASPFPEIQGKILSDEDFD